MRIYWITPWHQPPLRLTGGITACGQAPGQARGGSLCNLPVHPARPPQHLAVAAGSPSRRVAFSAVGDNCPLCQALDGKVSAGRLLGKVYSDAVLELYELYGGPAIGALR